MRGDLQAKLLRALDQREVRPVGGDADEAVDARVISATNRDLAAAVEEGGFRRDLFHRLAVVTLRLPPLRERAGDIPRLVARLLSKHGAAGLPVTPEAMRALCAWHWPGNVRELENELTRATLLRREPARLDAGDLSPELRAGPPPPAGGAAFDLRAIEIPDGGIDLAELEKTLIVKALEKTGGNRDEGRRAPRHHPPDAHLPHREAPARLLTPALWRFGQSLRRKCHNFSAARPRVGLARPAARASRMHPPVRRAAVARSVKGCPVRELSTAENRSQKDPTTIVIVVLSVLGAAVLAAVAVGLCAGW